MLKHHLSINPPSPHHPPSASPGPLPATPTGPSGSVFNFSSPPVVASPGKSFRPGSSKGPGRPVVFPNPESGHIGQNPGILNYFAGEWILVNNKQVHFYFL